MKDMKEPDPLQAKGWGKTAKVPDFGQVDGDVSEKIPPKRVKLFLEQASNWDTHAVQKIKETTNQGNQTRLTRLLSGTRTNPIGIQLPKEKDLLLCFLEAFAVENRFMIKKKTQKQT